MKYILNKSYGEEPARHSENDFPVSTPNPIRYNWFGGFFTIDDNSITRPQGITINLYYKSYYKEADSDSHPSEFLLYIDRLESSDYYDFTGLKAKGYFDYWDDMKNIIRKFLRELGFNPSAGYYSLQAKNKLKFDEFESIYNSFIESLLEYMNEY